MVHLTDDDALFHFLCERKVRFFWEAFFFVICFFGAQQTKNGLLRG